MLQKAKSAYRQYAPISVTEISKDIRSMLPFNSHISKISISWKNPKRVELCKGYTIVQKKGNKSVTGNYRPVSLTSVVCKCLERIIRALKC